MDSTADRELEMIRDDAHQTRAALANKLEALESPVLSGPVRVVRVTRAGSG